MTIDPTSFISKKPKQEESNPDAILISGSFVCQECNETCKEAKLDEAKRQIVWFCSENHRSEARL